HPEGHDLGRGDRDPVRAGLSGVHLLDFPASDRGGAGASLMQLLQVSAPARRWVLLSAALSVAGVGLSIAAGLLLGHLVAGVLGGEAPLGQVAPGAGEAQPGGIGQFAQRLDPALLAWLLAAAGLGAPG